MLQFVGIFLVMIVMFGFMFWKNKSKRPNTTTVDGMSQFSAFFFSMDHVQQVLNKGETLYPFAMTLYNKGKDSAYYNFTNEPKTVEEIITLIKADHNDIDLAYIVSNAPENSRLEVQNFLKGISKSDVLHVNYTITDGKCNIDGGNPTIVRNQDNFLMPTT